MSDQTSSIQQGTDESALSDEALESVSGGMSLTSGEPGILTIPPVMPMEPTVEPSLEDPRLLTIFNPGL